MNQRIDYLKKCYVDDKIGKEYEKALADTYFMIQLFNTKQLSYGWTF